MHLGITELTHWVVRVLVLIELTQKTQYTQSTQ